MVLNLSAMPSFKISSCTSNSIAHRDPIAASTYAVGTNFRSRTIPSQKGRLCAPEACMASWHPRRNSHAGRENGRPTTSRSLGDWSLLCKMVRPLSICRKFRASQAGLWTVTKHYPDRSICRVVRLATLLFGTSRLHQRSDLVRFTPTGTDTSDTVFRGTTANRRNYRNCSLRLKSLLTR